MPKGLSSRLNDRDAYVFYSAEVCSCPTCGVCAPVCVSDTPLVSVDCRATPSSRGPGGFRRPTHAQQDWNRHRAQPPPAPAPAVVTWRACGVPWPRPPPAPAPRMRDTPTRSVEKLGSRRIDSQHAARTSIHVVRCNYTWYHNGCANPLGKTMTHYRSTWIS